jgi:hypothetical protein
MLHECMSPLELPLDDLGKPKASLECKLMVSPQVSSPVCGAPGRGSCMIFPEYDRVRARREMQPGRLYWNVTI